MRVSPRSIDAACPDEPEPQAVTARQYQQAPADPDGPRHFDREPGFAEAALRALGMALPWQPMAADASQPRATHTPGHLPSPAHAGVQPVSAELLQSLARCSAACRVLDAALREEDPGADVVTAVAGALGDLLGSREPHEAHVDRALVGFLRDAIVAARFELISACVDTIAAAAPQVISEGRVTRLLQGLATPVSPLSWSRAADRAAADAQAPGSGARNPMCEPAVAYVGPPLLGRLCRQNRLASTPVTPSEATAYLGMHRYLCTVLESPTLELLVKVEVALSDFHSVHLGDDTARGRARPARQCATAVEVAMKSRHIGAACALLHALSTWQHPGNLRSQLFRQMNVDAPALFGALDAAVRRGDRWSGLVSRSWAPAIAELAGWPLAHDETAPQP